MKNSRTAKSVRNSAVAMAMFAVTLIVQFFSRKVFLDQLGTEILGLNTTASNLLEFLNLAELGVASAVGSMLYKPLFDGDHERIRDIVTFQGWIYRRVAIVLIIGAIILGAFFPLIFSKMKLPIWYAYASFGVLLFSSLLGYFFNYRQGVLVADQQDYRFILSYKLVLLSKIVAQMIAVKWLSEGYIWWLVLEVIFAIIASLSLHLTVLRTYPYLKRSEKKIGRLRREYPELEVRLRQIFYHKLGQFAVSQSSPLVIYAFTSLTLVTYYGNYMIVVYAITSLVTALFSSMGGAVGSLVAEGDRKRIVRVFGELFSVRFLFIATLTFAMAVASRALMTVWVGPGYVLPGLTVALITVNMFIYVSRATVDNFLLAYGLYSDVYSPLVLVVLNIGLSVLFGWLWGLNGILLGVGISLFVILLCWEPYYLFTRGLKAPFRIYISLYLRHLFWGLVAALVPLGLLKMVPTESLSPWSALGWSALVCLVYIVILAFALIFSHSGVDRFIARFRKR